MPSKSEQRRHAAAQEVDTVERSFYFPTIGNGLSIMATSQEQANIKLEEYLNEQAELAAREDRAESEKAEKSKAND